MLKDISARLTKIVEQKRLKQKLERDLHAVDVELREKSTRLTGLSSQLDKEKVDVEKLEHTSLTALFYSVLGSREQQLDKERQELLSAQLSYQKTKHQVEFLERDQEIIVQRLEGLADVESEYETLFSEKELLLRQSNQAVADKLFGLSEQIANLNSQKKEISEAITAGNRVISSLEQVVDSLENAKSWGTWDLLGGDLIATAVKHSKIDDARDGIDEVQAKMSQLTRELADIQKSADLKIDITEFETFADFFMDGLIFDWIVQSKIVDSLDRSKNVKDSILQLVNELEALKETAQNEITELQEEHAHLIEHA